MGGAATRSSSLTVVAELSVVVPVYGCAECLRPLHERLTGVLRAVSDSYEIIFVDDRSRDGAWPTLNELAAQDSSVRAVRLSRNFGQHAAITAGLAKSTGRWTVVLDCDLQDPPEEIPRLYEKAQEGFDVVLARRAVRHQRPLRRIATRAYYRVRRALLRLDVDPEYCTLSLLSRKVVDAFLELRDRDRQYMLILHWLGFERAVVEVPSAERYAGRSAYTLRALVRLGLDGMFFQTTTLLRWIVYAGFLIAAFGLILAGVIGISHFSSDPLPGWTSIVVLVLCLTGFIIVSTGVTGLYIGRIFEQVKGRPLYVIDEDVQADSFEPAAARIEQLERSPSR